VNAKWSPYWGANGVGKTTALCAIMGACEIETGTIDFDGQSLVGLPSHVVSRHGIALVPQGRRLFGNSYGGGKSSRCDAAGRRSLDEAYQLFPKLRKLQNATAQICRRRAEMVAIARALMIPSRLILLDEPFEGTAPAVVDDIMTAISSYVSVPA
jgi:ABC-type branched-subunit amino acid transport system ATPase component